MFAPPRFPPAGEGAIIGPGAVQAPDARAGTADPREATRGDWRSWLARDNDTVEVTGSSPVSPTFHAVIQSRFGQGGSSLGMIPVRVRVRPRAAGPRRFVHITTR